MAQGESYGGALLWSVVIVGLCVGMFFLVSFVRKRMRENVEEGPVTGFTLADLRDLHRGGKMSDEEFERAKATLVSATKAAAAKSAAEKSAAGARRTNGPSL